MRLALTHVVPHVCALCLLFVAAGNLSAASLISNGDFESLPDTTAAGDATLRPNAGDPIGGWQINAEQPETKSSVATIGTIPGTTNRALWLLGDGSSTGTADKGVAEHVFSQPFTTYTDKLVVQFDTIAVDDYLSLYGAELDLMDGDFNHRGPSIQCFRRHFGGGMTNSIAYYSDFGGGSGGHLGPFTFGETYSFRASTDLVTGSYDLYVRGGSEYSRWTQIGKQLPFRHTGAAMPTKFDRIGFGKFNTYTNSYVDNVVVESSDTFYGGVEFANNFDSYAGGNLLGQDGWRLGEGLTGNAQVVANGAGKAVSVSGTAENAGRTAVYQNIDAVVEAGIAHFSFDGKLTGTMSTSEKMTIAVGDSMMYADSWDAIAAGFGLSGGQFSAYDGGEEILSGVSAAAGTWYSFDATLTMSGAGRNTWSLLVKERDSAAVVWDTETAGISLDFLGENSDVTRLGILVESASGSLSIDNVSISVQPNDAPYNPFLPGDVDHNGKVNAADAAVLAANWLQAVQAGDWSKGDFNGDGMVDDIDAAMMAANWTVPDSGSVAEPSSLILLCGGGLFALAFWVCKRFARKEIPMKTIFACLLCATLWAICDAVSASLIVNGDFESLAIGTPPDNNTQTGGWRINADNPETNDSVITIDTVTGGSNKALHIRGGHWTGGLAEQVFSAPYYASENNKLVIEYDQITVDDPCSDSAVAFYAMGGDFAHRGPAVDFIKTENGLHNTIAYYSDAVTDNRTLGNKRLNVYTPGETYRMRIGVDMVNNTYDLYVRGGAEYPHWKQLGTNLQFCDAVAGMPGYIDRIAFGKFATNTNAYIDNVVVRTTDEDPTGVRYSNTFESYSPGTLPGQDYWWAREGELSRLQIVDGGAGAGKVASMSVSTETNKRASLYQDIDAVIEAGAVHFKVDALVTGTLGGEQLQFALGGDDMVDSGVWPLTASFGFLKGAIYVYDGNGAGGGTNVSTVAYSPDAWYSFDATIWMSGEDRNYWKLVVKERDTGVEVLDTDTYGGVGLELGIRRHYSEITRIGMYCGGSDTVEARFDNFEVSVETAATAVPEPAALATLIWGSVASLLLFVRRR